MVDLSESNQGELMLCFLIYTGHDSRIEKKSVYTDPGGSDSWKMS